MREIFITGAAAVTPLGRDLETTALRLAAGESGKWKTALQMVGILCLVLHFPHRVLPLWPDPVDLNNVGQWLVVLSMVFSVTSAVEYVRLFGAAVEAKEQRLGS